ncbi:MAG: conjugal transfer protein TraF, partial [SAR324 cluster bacterium]|nr:conjugal transfer protein TraF [SAR324 cluster bacterium]
ALGMGNAFVAVANDENALFYNPAGLQAVQRHIFEILTLNGTANQNLIDLGSDLLNSESSDDQTTALADLVGKKIYVEGNLGFLSLTAPGWGYSLFGSFLLDAKVRNPPLPYLKLKSYLQYGAIGGMALNFLDETVYVGVSYKIVSRNGVGKDVHIVDFLADNFLDDLQDEFSTKTNLSPDVGVIYKLEEYYSWDPKVALVVRNIGGMDFGSSGEIPMTIDLGIATESELAGFDIIFALDMVDITYQATEYRSFKRNLKMGVELGMWKRSNSHHALSFRLGKNGAYASQGFSINVPYFPMKIDYASWSEEIGNLAGDIEDKRQSLQISFNF